MTRSLDQAFCEYDRGNLSRRELLAAIVSCLAAGSVSAGAQVPPTGGGAVDLNHINLRVESVQRSVEFYGKFFGLSVKRTATYHALDLGGGRFMSLQTKADVDREVFRQAGAAAGWARTPSLPAGILEHFCIEVDTFDVQRTLAALKADGREGFVVGDNLFTSDPDGILVQVVDSKQRFAHEG